MRILFTAIGLIIADMLYLVFLSGSDSFFQPQRLIMLTGKNNDRTIQRFHVRKK